MPSNANLKRSEWLLKAVAFAINAAAVIMLILKLGFGIITNDDLIVVIFAVFLANVAIALVQKRRRTGTRR